MIKGLLKVLINFVLFVALQVLILDNIHLFKIVTPFLYIYVILKMPINLSRTQIVTISFLLGLAIDMFSNTWGMHAAVCSFAGFIRNPLLKIFLDKDMVEDASPSYRTLGTGAFMRYAISLVVIHHVFLFLIESFSFFDPLFLLLRIVLSIILTILCIFIVETFSIEKRRSGNI
ncbi:MAG: rod shape-determining protein MreD [Tannerella sp.]|jgi:rod shape-determining protein MreD|nr:rod shape-determining protein MreD [Tannerella sp.]